MQAAPGHRYARLCHSVLQSQGEEGDAESKNRREDCRPGACWEMMCVLPDFYTLVSTGVSDRSTPGRSDLQLLCAVLLPGIWSSAHACSKSSGECRLTLAQVPF